MSDNQLPVGNPSNEFMAWLIAQAINAEARGDSGLARVWWDTVAWLNETKPRLSDTGDDSYEVHGE